MNPNAPYEWEISNLKDELAALQQEVARLNEELEREQQRGDGWGRTAENYKNQLESAEQEVARLREETEKEEDVSLFWQNRCNAAESSLLALREVAQSFLDNDDPESHSDKCVCSWCKLRSALSTTSAQAEGIKARLQADALNEAAEEMPNIRWKGWLRARAAQLTAKTGEGK